MSLELSYPNIHVYLLYRPLADMLREHPRTYRPPAGTILTWVCVLDSGSHRHHHHDKRSSKPATMSGDSRVSSHLASILQVKLLWLESARRFIRIMSFQYGPATSSVLCAPRLYMSLSERRWPSVAIKSTITTKDDNGAFLSLASCQYW